MFESSLREDTQFESSLDSNLREGTQFGSSLRRTCPSLPPTFEDLGLLFAGSVFACSEVTANLEEF